MTTPFMDANGYVHPVSEVIAAKLAATNVLVLDDEVTFQQHRQHVSEALAMFVDEHRGIFGDVTKGLKLLEHKGTQRLLQLDAMIERNDRDALSDAEVEQWRAQRKAAVVRVQDHLTQIESLQADMACLERICQFSMQLTLKKQ